MRRSIASGLGGIFSVFSVLALGCLAPTRGGGDEITAETGEAVNWLGCPNDVVVTTLNYAPPHAFPGHCHGPQSRQQAEWDGAIPDLSEQCGTYCGQSHPLCGAAADLDAFQCIDRDIGHRWGALCICGPAVSGPGGPGPVVGPIVGPLGPGPLGPGPGPVGDLGCGLGPGPTGSPGFGPGSAGTQGFGPTGFPR